MATIIINFSFFFFFISGLFFGCAGAKSSSVISETNRSAPVIPPLSPTPAPNFGPQRPNEKYFIEKTKQFGLDKYRALMIYAVDLNQDDWTDLVLLPDFNEVPVFLTFNPVRGQFEKMLMSPLQEEVRASFLAFADFNRDGAIDLVVGNFNQNAQWARTPLRIFAGIRQSERGLVFEEQLPPIETDFLPISSVGLLDYDLDGNLDLFAGVWYDYRNYPPAPLPDRLYRGKNFQFTPVHQLLENEQEFTQERGFYQAVPAFGVSTCDLDQNGFPDILVPASSGYANKLWLNMADQKGRVFKDYGVESDFAQDQEGQLLLQGGGNSFFSVCADYNSDGMMDLLLGELSHSYDPPSKDRTSLLTNTRPSFPPKFFRSELSPGGHAGSNWGQGDKRGSFVDFNLDGRLDLIVDNTGFPSQSRLMVLLQQASHEFVEMSAEWGLDIVNPSGTVLIDLNHDGYLDVITGQAATRNHQIIPRMYVFENQLGKNLNNQGVKFLLQGKSANSQGIGAMVIVYQTDGRIQRQYAQYLSGAYPSQNEVGLTFGLGALGKIQKVEVRWPLLEGKSQQVLHKIYHFAGRPLPPHAIFTLCEDGTTLEGKNPCP